MGRSSRRLAAAFLAVVLSAAAAGAEESNPAPLVISPEVIQRAIATAQQDMPTPPAQFAARQLRTSSASTGRRVLWTSIGAVGGFFAGGYIGSWTENAVAPCGCDDPGLKGALIGLPIGAIAGGVAGFLLSK